MNKRGKKKFIAKHRHKKWSYVKICFGYGVIRNLTPYKSETWPGMISGFIQYMKENDPFGFPPICGFERYSGPTEFKKLEEGIKIECERKEEVHSRYQKDPKKLFKK